MLGGRTVRLSSVDLRLTYGGVLEGYPQRNLNDAHVRDAARRLAERYPGTPHFVLEPLRTLRPEHDSGVGPPWEELPRVECLGFFTSELIGAPGELGLGHSCLAVAWWQENDGTVFSDSAREAFARLDWATHAEDRTEW